MSNLLKSKFLLGLMIVAILFVGAFAFVATTSAADCSITSTLKYGMRSAQVTCLQTQLGVTPATGYFGNLTKAAVKAFQTNNGLTADGIFGAKSRAALSTGVVVNPPATDLCPNGMTMASNCTLLPGGATVPLCPNGMTLASNCTVLPGNPVVTTGPLAVSLATTNPASGAIVAGQATANLAEFSFTGTGTLSAVTLKRGGISDQNTLTNVYLYDGMTRLTDGYSFNNTGEMTINNLNLAVSGSKILSVRADVSGSTTSYGISIELTSYTVTGGTANMVSVKGNEMSIASAPSTLGAAIFNSANTVTGNPTVNPGTTGFTVWSSPIQVNQRALLLKSANFRVIGSAPSDALSNVKMYVDGLLVGTDAVSTTINGSTYLAFNFASAPVSLSTGSHTIDVRANVEKGSARTIQVSIQSASDMMLFDQQVGINVAVTASGTGAIPNSGASIAINQGTLSTTIDPAFQALTNLTGGSTNATVAKFKFRAYGEDVKINTLTVLPVLGTMTPTAAGLQNVTVYFNGSQIGSQTASWTSGNITLTPGSQMIVPAGVDSYLEVKADLRTTGSVNYTAGTASANLVAVATGGEGMNSKNSVAIVGVTGNTLTVQTAALASAKNPAYANQTMSPNTTNAKIGSFILQNQSSSESVRVTNLAVNLALTTADSTNYSNLKTSEASGSGSTPINPSTAAAGATSSNNFSVNFTLAPGATQVLDIFADLGSAATGSVIVSMTPTALGVSSNVNVSPSASQGQTITLGNGTFQSATLVSSSSTTAQFIAAANGATDGSKADFNLSVSGGTATVTEAKFVVRGSTTVSGLGTVSAVRVGTVSAPVVLATTNSTTLGVNGPNLVAGDTTVVLTSGTGVVAGSILTVGSEDMLVTVASSSPSFTVTRGYNGTTAAAHTDGDAVSVKNGVAYMTGLSLAVPNGGSGLTISAYPTYSAVGTNGVTSQSLAQISLSYLKYTMGGTTATDCVAGCTNAKAEVAAPTMQVVGSKPTLSLADSTDTLQNSLVKLAEVTVSADAKGDIKLVALPVYVSSTGVVSIATGTNNIVVKDTSGTTVTTTNDTFAVSAGGNDTSTITFTGDYLIPAGTSKTFRIYATAATVAGAVNTTSLSTSFGAASLLSWKDVAGANASAITSTNNTTYFFNYPTDTSVITN